MARWVWMGAFSIALATGLPAAGNDVEACSSRTDRGPQALAACTRIIAGGDAKGSDLAAVYFGRGMKYRLNGDYDRAIADFTSAIGIDPNWYFPYVARGHAHAEKGHFQRALADQDTAVRLEPSAISYVGRAQDLILAGLYDRAIADLDEALRLNPTYFYAFRFRGEAYLGKRDFDRALADYSKALEIGSNVEDMRQVRESMKKARNRVVK